MRRSREKASRWPGFLPLGALVWTLVLETAAAAPAMAAERRGVRLEAVHGRLSGEIHDAQLADVVEQLTRVTGIPVLWKGQGAGTRVSQRFAGLDPIEAIARLLREENFLLASAPRADGSPGLQIWITSAGPGPAALERGGARRDGPAAAGAGAAGAAPERPAAIAVAPLPGAGRERFLMGIPPAFEPLARVAASGDDPESRAASIRALEDAASQDSRLIPLLRSISLDDPDPAVRQAAIEVLGTASPN